MPLLRLSQSAIAPNTHRVDLRWEAPAEAPLTAHAEFTFELTAQDREDFRWYLEDYLQCLIDPADPDYPERVIARRVEQRMEQLGEELFRKIFQFDDDTRRVWNAAAGKLGDTRLEICTDVERAATIPWELLSEPQSNAPLALCVESFVRSTTQPAAPVRLPAAESGPIRILLVICRPGGEEDVPFRSVATRLLKGLSEAAREAFQLDVLRPATFESLSRTLDTAREADTPYHVVHFDGHGAYGQTSGMLSSVLTSQVREGSHGYLMFENPSQEENAQLIDGTSLGGLLRKTDVPVLVLNACRSAHAEAPEKPETPGDDVHDQVRAFGSLAQEIMDQGVAGVVAMRYNVYVVTAAQFVADLYEALTRGRTLGQAVSYGRKQLHDQPSRRIAYEARPLQDWSVPVVFEAAPVKLFPEPAQQRQLDIELDEATAAPQRGTLDPTLPPRPDVGFFGRDETLLALDRAFDRHPIVLLHAYAGSGKTCTAAEFARWYALTGGVDGPVLFTSFEHHKPLARVLDQIEQFFGQALEAAGVHWLTLNDEQRRTVALQALQQIPVLWIWDSVEPVAGFPIWTRSAWTQQEQAELVDFLRAARETKARFLLTSRRDEKAWLGDLPFRIRIPLMPMQEHAQLAEALARKWNRHLGDVDDWRPLLRFAGGNPLTITVLIGQALRDGLKTREQIEAFVEKLRAGEAEFEDELSEGRTKSLGASLSYGFEHAFTEPQRRILGLLYFFQGFVNVEVFCLMGKEDAGWSLDEVRGLTRDDGVKLLDNAAEVGLLASHGRGCYSIHPAVPWYLRNLFERDYGARRASATRAFIEAEGALAGYYHGEYSNGNRDVITRLGAEELNLLHAQSLARSLRCPAVTIRLMQGLRTLYEHRGNYAMWKALVEQATPEVADATTGAPKPGVEDEWAVFLEYRIRLARQERDREKAHHLQILRLDWDRTRAIGALSKHEEPRTNQDNRLLRSLCATLVGLGNFYRELGDARCPEPLLEAYELLRQIPDRPAQAVAAFALGNGYVMISAIRDLDVAEKWYRRSLDLRADNDRLGQAKCFAQLALVSLERFAEAREAARPADEQLDFLNAAATGYQRALGLCPPDHQKELATYHNQLGNLLCEAQDYDRALAHYRHSVKIEEAMRNVAGVADSQVNIARTLAFMERTQEAALYAKAALRSYLSLTPAHHDEIRALQQFLNELKTSTNDR